VTAEDRLASALRSPDPAQGLRGLVLRLFEEGHTKADIYERLEKLLLSVRAREDYREADEDHLLEVMDALTGWCHPEAQLLPDDQPSG
jgi:hypothetical protein